jgi:hypothetical protein
MTATTRRRLVAVLATAAFGCIGAAVAATALDNRSAVFLAVAAVALIVAALATLRAKGRQP